MIALRGVHIYKMDPDSALPAVANDRAQLQAAAEFVFLNSKMNFDFSSNGILLFTQNADPDGTQVGQESRRQIAGRAEQDSPVGGPPPAGPSFITVFCAQGLM